MLKSFDFKKLLIEELGWNNYEGRLELDLINYKSPLNAVAEKKGMVVYQCPTTSDENLPDHSLRRKIENQVTKTAHEHLIIFTDADQATQIWQWIRREPGKPIACREHTLHKSQPGDSLIEKLKAISFSLEEEEILTLSDVTSRAKAGFDVERITKRFYDRFKKEHTAFLKFVKGITEKTDHEWYASVMLNRLMFVYFIQRKGFLDNDENYLRNRLARMRNEYGHNKFYSFYRYFLLRLFHEGLGGKARTAELENLLGKIPYFNGGFFEKHPVEQKYKDINIPDEAFERVFDYFDQYHWHLDERPLRNDNEINPDVLGYIFEKYINQKQMGAYYTKEDITEYISKNTVIPYLFDNAKPKCSVAFENPDGPTVWDLLSSDPDRYIYNAVKHGVINEGGSIYSEAELPDFVQKGMRDPKERMFEKRYNLEQALGDDPVRLVTETWREYVIRRNRCLEIRERLKRGEIKEINDLITLNLDIRQFAQDVIENCEGPDLLRAFWHTINGHIPEKSHEKYQNGITILDPTCGSGAFLFAALNILEALYEACLERMSSFVEDLELSGEKHRPEKYSDFKRILSQVDEHPNRRYFIYKNIILNNLFGVDIMEEAVEICKLRLFLKLVAQVEPDRNKENFGIEPLPDIDFNIRTGNTLVGYATAEEVKNAFKEDPKGQKKLLFGEVLSGFEKFKENVELADSAFKLFRQMQVDPEMKPEAFSDAKNALRERLKALEDELNLHLAEEYGINTGKQKEYEKWLKSHQPFHWFVEFYGIMKEGGFDVIMGNPPYVFLKQLKNYSIKNFNTISTNNLYSVILERCQKIIKGYQGYIVPISSTATEGYKKLQEILIKRKMIFVSFDDRPAHLFDGLDKNTLSIIFLFNVTNQVDLFSSRLNRWNTEERKVLFPNIAISLTPSCILPGCLPRIGSVIEYKIWERMFAINTYLTSFCTTHGESITYYSRKVNSFLQILNFVPKVYDGKGNLRHPSEFKSLQFSTPKEADTTLCLLNSSLFRWFIDIVSDGSHLNKRELESFPFDFRKLNSIDDLLSSLAENLSKDLKKNSFDRKMVYKHDSLTVQCIVPKFSKQIIDEIDQTLARHYAFSDEELDFIINYDIKYRIGKLTDAEED